MKTFVEQVFRVIFINKYTKQNSFWKSKKKNMFTETCLHLKNQFYSEVILGALYGVMVIKLG